MEALAGYLDNYNYSGFAPIPELRVADSDIAMVTLESRVGYTSPVLDPWFRATSTKDSNLTNSEEEYISSSSPLGTSISYYPDRMLSILGCTEQYQFAATPNVVN